MITIPKACCAGDEDLAAKRKDLAKKLLEGKRIVMDNTGNVSKPANPAQYIPGGKLAADSDEALRRKREELKKKLVSGQPINIASTGNVTGKDGGKTNLVVPKGKLALDQWYESNPLLLEAEKTAMAKAFPHFTLDKMDDGRLYWYGSLNVGVLGDNVWNIMAVYSNNHPHQEMGSTVRVYLVEPDINELIDGLGWQPHHLLIDSNNQLFLCTTEAEYVKDDVNREVTSAASVIAWAVKWILAFELVLSGDLSREEFDKPHGI